MRSETAAHADNDRRDLLAALADDTHSALIERLREGSCTQAALQSDCGLSTSVVSRGLKHLRALGLISSSGGRDAVHTLLQEKETQRVIDASARLQQKIIERRARALKASVPAGGHAALARPPASGSSRSPRG